MRRSKRHRHTRCPPNNEDSGSELNLFHIGHRSLRTLRSARIYTTNGVNLSIKIAFNWSIWRGCYCRIRSCRIDSRQETACGSADPKAECRTDSTNHAESIWRAKSMYGFHDRLGLSHGFRNALGPVIRCWQHRIRISLYS
jgi:hypothetical protein